MKLLILQLLCLACLFTSFSSQAHPHSWVELQTEIDGNQNGIIGFKMKWTFDADTSTYMLEGSDLSPGHKEQSFQEIADSVITNMLADHYFTYFYKNEEPVRYKRAITPELHQEDNKLILTFYLPLSKPQPATGNDLKLLIFEPTYYVDMSWNKQSDIKLSSALEKFCSIQLNEPNPTPEQLDYAVSLPADADPDSALGQLFTQTVTLNCL